jgi:PD-(D/E)XK nuclease superfamily
MDAGCWFDSDKAGSPEMTAFKREARWRQHRWAVDRLSNSSFGTHPGRATDPDGAPEDIPNGTKLRAVAATAGSNFRTPNITPSPSHG